jgi:hypothetical protein
VASVEEYKKNPEIAEENKQLEEQIALIEKRIEINQILKEVDIEELRVAAKSNRMVSANLKDMIKRWSQYEA